MSLILIVTYVLSAAVLLYALFTIFNHILAHQKVKHIPGVRQFLHPFINIPGIKNLVTASKKQMFLDLWNICKTYGQNGVVALTMHNQPQVIIFDPEHIKYVMIKNAKNYPKPEERYGVFNIFGPNILTTNGDEWRRHRSLSNPAFNIDHIKHVSYITNEVMKDILKNNWNQESIILDVVDAMTSVTLEIMGLAGFGVDLGVMKAKVDFDRTRYTMSLKEAITISSGEAVISRFRYPAWMRKLPLTYFRHIEESIRNTDRYLEDLIQARKNSTEERFDLLSLLITSRDENNKNGLDAHEIKSDSFIFLFAGHETTASQLMWTLWLLATHPNVQEKVYAEVSTLFEGRTELEHEDYEKLQYLQNVVRESMRIHPPVAGVQKLALKDDIIGGYKIKAGTLIGISIYSVHHDPQYWKDPEEFIPERWNEENKGAYLPFSMGSRKCIGFAFSLHEAIFILAHIIHTFTVSVPDKYKKKGFKPYPEQMITIKPKELHLQFNKRINVNKNQ